ncbi:MAG: RnfABCDGE type electron transport complex subunit D [Candidatus Omnitrophica bacterium]|nr:RnfABCDGE type electron transport complex subunit D [Candidatus Omnitrophota bacterium]
MEKKELKLGRLVVSSSPHIEEDDHIIRRMWATFIALLPVGFAGVYIFGIHSLYVILVSLAAAALTEIACQKMQRRKVTASDGSALICGLLLAYNLPPDVPVWIPILGTVFAVGVGKHLFGGLGFNIFNPALVGRAFLMTSWPTHMTSWTNPRFAIDAVSSATPLTILKEKGVFSISELPLNYWDLFIGNRGGCIGEVCVIALLVGAAYLLYKQYISWQTPISFILTTGFLSWVFSGSRLFSGDFLLSILSGGLILGAFFMATDYVTGPLTKKGKLIFGLGCGLITFLIRKYGGYPEGVSYAILTMNAFVPTIDRFCRLKPYGFKRG